MDHPFHQHVNAAQVQSITGGDADYAALYTKTPAWKDVVIVPKGGTVKLLVPVMDYPGMAMFHCHILEHEDIGMMGMWDIGSTWGGLSRAPGGAPPAEPGHVRAGPAHSRPGAEA